jgi:hypothetical protein
MAVIFRVAHGITSRLRERERETVKATRLNGVTFRKAFNVIVTTAGNLQSLDCADPPAVCVLLHAPVARQQTFVRVRLT